ncbi:metallophosphoesterase [Faucicola mancuniensis]|uniref:metallophosphoesterase n=1 Tax=Faucicola mancuniensis TaxID=1309795 RepID=UPI0039773E27
MIYDIIGDIHGQADKLIGLLNKLGYQDNGKFFQAPPNHKAIFIGDFVDRGAKQLDTLNIVFNMLDNSQALAVMGNHEYNALAFATLDKRENNQEHLAYLRKHNDVHTKQHQEFLDEVGFGSDLHKFWLKRLYELPLWLELDNACFVHACWDEKSMSVLKPLLTDKNQMTEHGLQLTSYKGTDEYNALERVLKGVEVPLPDGVHFFDKEQNKRHNVRVEWWLKNLSHQPIHQIARASKSDLVSIPMDAMSGIVDFAFRHHKPIFIGHYWLNGTPMILAESSDDTAGVVCVDYSAGRDGFLTAYQFDTENPMLSNDNFVQFEHF